MKTNKKRQAAYKERMRKAGFIQVQVWIRPEWKNTVNELINRLTAGEENR